MTKNKPQSKGGDRRREPPRERPEEPGSKKDQTVSDPHPGSVSDGTHPEASEGKR